MGLTLGGADTCAALLDSIVPRSAWFGFGFGLG